VKSPAFNVDPAGIRSCRSEKPAANIRRRRLGRNAEAALAYEAAIARTKNAAEREFLLRSREALARS
jgi:predicted RNA polymerase sigma factor